MIKLNTKYALIKEEYIEEYRDIVSKKHNLLHNRTGVGSEFMGWLDLPSSYDKVELERIKESAKRIQETSDVLVVVGIGGSYLGARAIIEACKNSFGSKKVEVLYAGHNLSATYMCELLEYIKNKQVSINIISKSGTTTEPAIAFRILKEFMEDKYGKVEAAKRIYATTDKEKGALRKLATKERYETFVVPDDVGGRYSVLTAVGLLPIAVAGIDVDKLLMGAQDAMIKYKEESLEKNSCYQYAVLRDILYKQGKKIEFIVTYDPKLIFFSGWLKQLFGESHGKNEKGLFLTGVYNTTDLHSIGQYIQDGPRIMFETVISVRKRRKRYNYK